MSDQAHEWTDDKIEDICQRFRETYIRAANEMQDSLESFLHDFAEQNIDWQERVERGSVTESQYKEWLSQKASDQQWQSDMIDRLSMDAMNADRLAMDAINDELPRIYGENANYMAYDIDSMIGYDTKFTLYDTETVRNLLINDPKLYPTAKISVADDLLWNRRKLSGEVAQGILRGESIPKMADRLRNVLRMDENSAIRAARTAATAAENLGRMKSIKRAKDIGIRAELLWIATLDGRTRHSHRELDMRHVPVGMKFRTTGGVELACPGDPECTEPSEIYNCRCTLGAWMPQIDFGNAGRWERLPDGMTYDDWKTAKEVGNATV